MEIRRSTAFRLLLTATFLVLMIKVCVVMVKPICTIAESYGLCECGLLTDEGKFTDYSSVFLMTQKEAGRFDLHEIHKLLSVPFNFSTENINIVKRQLSTMSDPSMLIASKSNMGHTRYVYAIEDRLINKIPHDIFSFLSKKTYVTFGNPSRCSVVGSSGILNNSSCGKQIDSADFVIRFNIPKLRGYKKDVGSKSKLTTLNPSQIEKQFGRLIHYEDRLSFLQYVKQYGRFLWVSAFASAASMDVCRSLLRAARLRIGSSIIFGHPYHFRIMTTFWRSKGVGGKKRLSSGIYWVANALSFCDEVHLYGFWPFAINYKGKKLRYHYYEDEPPGSHSAKSHSFGEEFRALLRLHKKGVLRLHVDKCES